MMLENMPVPSRLKGREVREFAQLHQFSPDAFCKLLEKLAEQQGVYEQRLKDLAFLVDRTMDMLNNMQLVGEKMQKEMRATRRQQELQGEEEHG